MFDWSADRLELFGENQENLPNLRIRVAPFEGIEEFVQSEIIPLVQALEPNCPAAAGELDVDTSPWDHFVTDVSTIENQQDGKQNAVTRCVLS